MANPLIQSVLRAADLLELVAGSEEGQALGDLARGLNVSLPTAHNLARTLVARGLLAKTAGPVRYRLGPGLFALVRQHNECVWRRRAEGEVRALFTRLGTATILLAERLGSEPLPTLRMDPSRPAVLERVEHRVMPAYTSAIALCFQAFLPGDECCGLREHYPFVEYGLQNWGTEDALNEFLERARQRGLVEVATSGPFRVAAPIFGRGEQLVGAIGASLNRAEGVVDRDVKRAVRQAVLATARALSGGIEGAAAADVAGDGEEEL